MKKIGYDLLLQDVCGTFQKAIDYDNIGRNGEINLIEDVLNMIR